MVVRCYGVATISIPIILVISVDKYSGIYMHQPSWWLGAKSVLHQQLGSKVEEIQPLILESVHVVLQDRFSNWELWLPALNSDVSGCVQPRNPAFDHIG